MPAVAPAGSRYSLRASLLALVAWCAVPLVLVASALVWQNYRLQRTRVFSAAVEHAREIGARLERELSGVESSLRVLSISPPLLAGDLAAFHRLAREAVATQIACNYVLTDRSGRQIVNTSLPYGAPLPSGTPPQIGRVFSDGVPVLSGLFTSPVTGKHAIAFGVPVWRGGEVRYSLNVGLSPEAIGKLLALQRLPEGWVVSVLDGSGVIVARSVDADRLVGRPAGIELRSGIVGRSEGHLSATTPDGEPMFEGFRRLGGNDWTVVAAAPQRELDRQLHQLIAFTAAATLLALLLGVWLALRVVRRVMASVDELNEAARSICAGEAVALPVSQLIETEAVGAAIAQASEAAARIRYMAQHDALTGLANRVLFYELLQHQTALAQRQGGELALLALDLDGFKAVNDNYGHAAGDRVLREAAGRILAAIRVSDAAARMGGDEFAVLLCDADRASAEATVARLVDALAQPYEGIACPVSASVGVAVFPSAACDVEDLMWRADSALYAAKRAGKGQSAFADDGSAQR